MNLSSESVLDYLSEITRLLELKGENPFKVRAFDKAAEVLAGRSDLLERAKKGTLREISGIGKGIEEVLKEYLLYGKTTVRDELAKSLPTGLLELTQIPGLGPKKAMDLIEKLGIQSIAELEYACNENRLLKLKGYGLKLQQKILDGIMFQKTNQGFQKFSDVDSSSRALKGALKDLLPDSRVSETGSLRRRSEVLSHLEFLIEYSDQTPSKKEIERSCQNFLSEVASPLPVQFYFAPKEEFGFELAKTTATPEHWNALDNPKKFEAYTEEEFYEKLELPWIPPEVRETGEEVKMARQGKLEDLLPWNGIRGVFHNHTVRSDGSATLEQMVAAAEKMGLDYIGISDHSQSAFYAQGLKHEQILEQEIEIRTVQKKYPKVRIFWGIESDILADGSLDYDSDILKKFDFVIASVHSRFQMERGEMTQRILKAIRNPYTRFLGHPTGRLLLGRKAYEVDMEALILEASKCNVAIELNANPARLDIDWRWGAEMRKHKTFTSINPDAHETAGLENIQYGIAMARKALLPADCVVNSKSVEDVEKWLKRA